MGASETSLGFPPASQLEVAHPRFEPQHGYNGGCAEMGWGADRGSCEAQIDHFWLEQGGWKDTKVSLWGPTGAGLSMIGPWRSYRRATSRKPSKVKGFGVGFGRVAGR